MQIDLNLVPENIKNTAWRASPENKFTNLNEKMVAEAQLRETKKYCEQVLAKLNFGKKKQD